MHKDFFALRHHPFSRELRPDEMFAFEQALEAETRLQHLIDLRGIGLVIGPSGVGKTSLLRKVTHGLNAGLFQVHYMTLTTGSVIDTYNIIAATFGLGSYQSRAKAWHMIRAEITRVAGEARKLPILVVDEAHLLRNDILEELRLLTNFEMDASRRLCLVLCGLTSLHHRLGMSIHESLAQRIVVTCHLSGLTRDEVGGYIGHRMRLAGADVPIFQPDAIEAVALECEGLPRRIDRIAHNALHAAASTDSRTVNAGHVEMALGEIRR